MISMVLGKPKEEDTLQTQLKKYIFCIILKTVGILLFKLVNKYIS
jgi:hypothetical protein